MNRLELSFDNNVEALAEAVAKASAFLAQHAASVQSIYQFEVVLEELGTNVIRYAFDDLRRHELELVLTVGLTQLTVRLSDNGIAFDPRATTPKADPKSIAATSIGGRGLEMVKRMTAHLDWERLEGRNVVTFTLPLKA